MRPSPSALVLLACLLTPGLAAGEPLTVVPEAPWQATQLDGQPGYTIAYDGQGEPILALPLTLKPDTHYRLQWEMQGSVDDAKGGVVSGVKTGILYEATHATGTAWATCYLYFHSGSLATTRATLSPRPGAARTVRVRAPRLTALGAQDLEHNLLPNPDFELATALPVNWWANFGSATYRASIVPSRDFLTGERSMLFDTTGLGDARTALRLASLPVVPGRTVAVSFWAKAEPATEVMVLLDAWVYPHQGTHFHRNETFRVATEWREFSFTAAIPGDLAAYPDLASRQIALCISSVSGAGGKILFDQFSYLHKP